MRRLVPFIYLFFAAYLPVFAQQAEKITIDLNSSSIKAATFPFDVPFTLTGKAPDDCYQINFSYKISDDELTRHPWIKKWCNFPNKVAGSSYKAAPWSKTASETTFFIDVPGMHPDIKYDFSFQLLRTVPGDDVYKNDLKQKVAAAVQAYFAKLGTDQLTQAKLDQLADALKVILITKITNGQQGLTLKQKDHPNVDFQVDLRAKLLPNISIIFPASSTSAAANTAIYGPLGQLQVLTPQFLMVKDRLATDIDAVLANNPKLTANSVALLEQPIANAPDAFKSYTRRAGLLVLKKMCQAPEKLTKLLKGTAQIANNDVTDVKSIDPSSISYLAIFLDELYHGSIKIDPSPGTNVFAYLNTVAPLVTAINANVKLVADAKAVITAELDKFPDLTAEIIVSQMISSQTVSITDVTSQSTPYISAEGGLGYASAFQAGVSYLGANFYLSPVNKKAKLGDFRGWNRFKKSFCFFIGYTTIYGDRPAHTYSIIGSGNSDFMLGAGWRLGRIIKLGISGMPYRVSYNPLTDDKTIKVSAVFSIGIDVNLLGALGGVAKGLKLTSN